MRTKTSEEPCRSRRDGAVEHGTKCRVSELRIPSNGCEHEACRVEFSRVSRPEPSRACSCVLCVSYLSLRSATSFARQRWEPAEAHARSARSRLRASLAAYGHGARAVPWGTDCLATNHSAVSGALHATQR